MREWLRFFFGTPRRFVATVAVVGMVVVILSPGLLYRAASGLVRELWPLVQLFLMICIVIYGFRLIIFGRSK